VSFNASGSSDSDGSITSYAWSFGDGGSSSGVTTSHTYNSASTYTAQLTVTDNDGSTDSATRTIQVSPTPVANNPPTASFTASPTSGDAPLAVSFNASGSSDSDGSITSYAWSFGDGGSSSGVTASHTYTSAGTYTAQLIVTDDDGSTDFATRTIQVDELANQEPHAEFSHDNPNSFVEIGQEVAFDASLSYDLDGEITSYTWNFGDGWTANGCQVVHKFEAEGYFTVRLTVADDEGSTDSASFTFYSVPFLLDLALNINIRGLTTDGQSLWICSWQGGIQQIDPLTGSCIRTLPAPGTYPTGLALNGTNLWCGDGATGLVYKLSIVDGEVLQTYIFPETANGITALEWDHEGLGGLWYTVQVSKKTIKVDVESMNPTIILTHNAVPEGLALDATGLYVVFGGGNLQMVDPQTGQVLDSASAPGGGPKKICNGDGFLWVGWWNHLYKLHASEW
jgi:PKD repeat protein